jgi:hypothetical protein
MTSTEAGIVIAAAVATSGLPGAGASRKYRKTSKTTTRSIITARSCTTPACHPSVKGRKACAGRAESWPASKRPGSNLSGSGPQYRGSR